MAKAGLCLLPLPVVQEEEELIGDDVFVQSSGQTPNAKRQRRLTLTAMTGLICELAKEHEEPCSVGKNNVASEADARVQQEVVESVSPPLVPKAVVEVESIASTQREPSPVRRLKRARASISVTATAEVMAAQAARTLTASGSKSSGRSRKAVNSSESSDSTEDEEDSLALRVRRAKAFECGVQTVTQSAESGASQGLHDRERDLSPGSKIAFSQGVRAAQVAAKVAAKMASPSAEPGAEPRNVVSAPTSARKSGPEVPSLSLRLRGGA